MTDHNQWGSPMDHRDNEQHLNYAIKLDIFEGPLDLLLYLIKK